MAELGPVVVEVKTRLDTAIHAAFVAAWVRVRCDRDRAIAFALLVLAGAVLYSLAHGGAPA